MESGKNHLTEDMNVQIELKFSRDEHPAVLRELDHLVACQDPPPCREGEKGSGEDGVLRAKIHKYVLIAAEVLGTSKQVAWIRMYHEVTKRLHWSPIVEAFHKGYDSHLQALMEHPSGPSTALGVLMEFIGNGANAASA